MQMLSKISKLYILILIFSLPNLLPGQNALEVFGKNKVQYNDDLFDWWIYETKDFVIYWYGKSRPAAQFCIEIAETENNQVQKLFEYHLKDKIELVVYADPSDLAQSNINLDGIINDKTWALEPKIKDQKILLYFDGDHEHLRNLLRAGITQLYFNSMFSGTTLQDVVQKVISFRLPDWFEKGLIQYLSKGWKLEDQIQFYKIWNHNNFKKTSSRFPELAGQSFWNFLISTYGEQAISNWLYMTRIQKDIQTAARLVFSLTFDELQNEWFNFYNSQADPVNQIKNPDNHLIPIKLKSEEKITSIYQSTFSQNLILTSQQNGKARVRLFNPETKENRVLFKKGSRTKLLKTDFTYPIFFEDSINQTNYVFYERRNRVHLNVYNQDFRIKTTHMLPEEIQGVYSAAAYSKDIIVFSGNSNGYSDIIQYNIKSRQFKKLTDDIWDDLDLKIIQNQNTRKIAYRSNKPNINNKTTKLDSVLPLGKFSIFSFTLDQKLNKQSDKLEFELQDKTIKNWSSYQSDFILNMEERERNRWLIYKNDSTYEILSNIQPEIISSEIRNHELYYLVTDKSKTYLGKLNLNYPIKNNYVITHPAQTNKEDSLILNQKPELNDTLFFQSRFGNPRNILEILSEFDKKTNKTGQTKFSSFSRHLKYDYPKNTTFNSNLAIAYRYRFWIEDLSSTVNNDLLFSGLNTFSGTSKDYEPPPFGILFKTKLTELFENYSIEAGLRIPTSFDGLESFILFENRKKRFDHSFAAYFKTNTDVTDNSPFNTIKKQTNVFLINHQLKYALDHYKSLRAISTIRNDHIFYSATNKATLYDSIEVYQQRIGTRLEYVFDNALDISLNIKNGWQVKTYFEISKRFELNPEHTSKFYPGVLMIAGFDARLHLPVLSKSVFSNRCYVNSSFGRDRILYHVGGTENWLIPKYEDQTAIQTSGQYVYSALATEVRSYGYGARKASSVFGFSSELRIPILQYIINQNWKNSILRNFQIISFIDGAYVWDGFFPDFKSENNLTYHAENPAVLIDLQYSRTPFIAGTGFGLRTSLFGYFIRFDYAWKIESNGLKDPKSSFSLGLDF